MSKSTVKIMIYIVHEVDETGSGPHKFVCRRSNAFFILCASPFDYRSRHCFPHWHASHVCLETSNMGSLWTLPVRIINSRFRGFKWFRRHRHNWFGLYESLDKSRQFSCTNKLRPLWLSQLPDASIQLISARSKFLSICIWPKSKNNLYPSSSIDPTESKTLVNLAHTNATCMCSTATCMWQTLCVIYQQKSKENIYMLMKSFFVYKMSVGDSINTHINNYDMEFDSSNPYEPTDEEFLDMYSS